MHTTLSPVKIWRRQKYIRTILRKTGKIVTWTVIHIAGQDFAKEAPYPVVLVRFDNGEQAFGQLVDCKKEHLVKGQRVVSILRKVREPSDEGVIAYGLKFKPVQ